MDLGGAPRRAWLYALRSVPFATTTRTLLPEYTTELHESGYVEPGPGRDASLYQAWGGYDASA